MISDYNLRYLCSVIFFLKQLIPPMGRTCAPSGSILKCSKIRVHLVYNINLQRGTIRYLFYGTSLEFGDHSILQSDITHQRVHRSKLMCTYCTTVISNKITGVTLCSEYYALQLSRKKVKSRISVNVKPIDRMQTKLVNNGWITNPKCISCVETIDLYKSVIAKSSVDRFQKEAAITFIIYSPNEYLAQFGINQTINLKYEANFNDKNVQE